jgi:hypothetical protein
MDNVKKFRKIAEEVGNLYEKKNAVYGNSFGETYKKLGIVSAVTRISDKYNRLCTLAKNPDVDNLGESLEDTLKDMAAYSIMTLMEMEGEQLSPIGYDPVKEVDNLITSIKDDKQIRKGDMFECIEDVIMDDGEVSYVKGKVYASEVNGCITDEQHYKNHHWDCEAEYDCWYNCFKRL